MEIGRCDIRVEEIVDTLKKEQTLTLATCADNRVTIRPMSHINDGLTILFQTGKTSLKMQQMMDNPNVALYVGSLEIEGTASAVGHPLDKENTFLAQEYRTKHQGAFEQYSELADEAVVKVTIHHVRQWRYIDGKPFIAEWSTNGGMCSDSEL